LYSDETSKSIVAMKLANLKWILLQNFL
jgi:hypothetical protein